MATTIREEAERLSRVLDDRTRKPSIVPLSDGGVRINGAHFEVDDVLAIMREALAHRLGKPQPKGLVPLERHEGQFFLIRHFDDLRVHGFSADQVQRVGDIMMRCWDDILLGRGRDYDEHEEVPAIGIRFSEPGLGEFKVDLALCRAFALMAADHDGAVIYEPTAADVYDLALAEWGVILTPSEATALLGSLNKPDITERTLEAGLSWERQRERARNAVEIALSGRDLTRYTDAGRVAKTMTQQEVHAAVLADYELCCGRVALATVVEGFDAENNPMTVTCDPPAVIRVVEGGLGWTDEQHCATTYNVEVLEPHAAFEGIRPAWIHGTGRATDGTVEHAPFTVAPPDIQVRYRSTSALDAEQVAPAEPSAAPAV